MTSATQPLHVVHVVDSLAPQTGGPARTVPGMAEALARRGVGVTLVTREGGADVDGVEVVVTGRSGFAGRILSSAVSRALAENQAHLVHSHGVWRATNHGAASAARCAGCPHVVAPRGMLEPWALRRSRVRKRIARAVYQWRDLHRASLFHATADAEAAQLHALGFAAPAVVVPNGVDWSEMPEPGQRRARTEGPKRAVFLSRIHPKKGLLGWVEAWRRAAPRGWVMELWGPDEGGHRREVETAVAAAGLGQTWHFHGPADANQRAQVLADADLFVLPSHSENFGVVVAEALGAGVPVLTTHGAPWRALQTERAGWWVAPEIEALAAALRTAAETNPAELVAMGARGAVWARGRFAWEPLARQMEAAYRWLLAPTTTKAPTGLWKVGQRPGNE